jgi:ligand-binding sensor domain-containing protein
MEKTNSRWLYIFVLLSLASMFFFPKKVSAETNWLKYFRKDTLLNTYKRSYAVLDDTLFIGTFGDGLIIHSGKEKVNYTNKNTRSSPPRDDGMISDYITCIAIDEKLGRIWLGTNEGLSSCNLEGKEWLRYQTKDGLPNNVIRDLVIDNRGDLWVGTPSGIAQFNGEEWIVHTDKTGLLQNSVHSLKVKGNSLWVGTVGGTVSRYKNGEWTTFVNFN